MRALLLALLLPAAAHAGASASATVFNRTPAIVIGADGVIRSADGVSAFLSPGETLRYEFDYTFSVHDDGGAFISQGGPFWDSENVYLYRGGTGHGGPIAISTNLREIAVANLYLGDAFAGMSSQPPWVNFSGTWDYLATIADDLPQTFEKTGHGFASISIDAGHAAGPTRYTLPDIYTDVVGLGGVVSGQVLGQVAAVPEPAEWALMLVGMAALLLRHRSCTEKI